MLHLTLVRNVIDFPILVWQKWTRNWTKVVIHGNFHKNNTKRDYRPVHFTVHDCQIEYKLKLIH